MINRQPLELYSRKHIFITTALAGPLMGGYMLQRNFKNLNQQRASVLTAFLSYLLQAITYIAFLIIVELAIVRSGLYNFNNYVALMAAIGTLLLLHLGNGSLALLFKHEKEISCSGQKTRFYPTLNMLLTIGAGIVISFFLLRSGLFWFRFLSIYFLASFYAYHRLAKPFAKEWQRLVVMGLGFVLTLSYPGVNIINDFIPLQQIKGLQLFAYNYLGFMLYFFLLFMLIDIVMTALEHTWFRRKEKRIINRSRIYLSAGLLLAVSGIVARGITNFNTPKVNHYNVSVPAQSSSLRNLKIAMAADLHISELTKPSFIDQFVNQINGLNADIVLLPGDLVETGSNNETMRYMQEQLSKIKSKYGAFGVLGNHDYGRITNKKAFIKGANITLLTDTAVVIDDAFVLIGRQDRRRSRKPLNDILQPVTHELPWILLDHRPPDTKEIAKAGIDLSVSGHTHHGQLFPLNYITQRVYDLSWGYQQFDQTHVFVTCGAQGWGPTMRVGSQSEIMEINVNFE